MLGIDRIFHILTEKKADRQEKVQISMGKFEDYFLKGTPKNDVEEIIFMLLENYFQLSKDA